MKIFKNQVNEDTLVDIPGTVSPATGKPRQMRIYGQAEAIQLGDLTDREEPEYVADDDFDPIAVANRAGESKLTIFTPGGDVA
ncbi:hypothetical protein ST47_g1217 [Ascochyta rabiei]|uniref:Uncharacterized protein n=1 Tax=Didymella rabiei TaxID=5454 RepID=A0A163L5M9_DIDRA|nr:hypothetical protein ST47_g1217 [Ascochyta rabiei]